MLDHKQQLVEAATFLDEARLALAMGRVDLVQEKLQQAIGFANQVYGELEREYLIGRGAVLLKTSGSFIYKTITEEPLL